MDDLVCNLEMRPDGVVLVRVPPSNPALADSTPDAVFTFRPGDPQYDYWRARGVLQNGRPRETANSPTVAHAL
jgi:hypothetical protein